MKLEITEQPPDGMQKIYTWPAPQFRRRTSKCEECPYKDAKPSQRRRDELAYARCTPPEEFHCHMGHERENWSGSYGYGDGETMCRGHWEAYRAAVKRGIEADESAGDRVFEDGFHTETDKLIDSKNKSLKVKNAALSRSMERLVRRFGSVWVASQDGMAAIGATRKDALAGLADCIKCKTSLQIIHTWATFQGGCELVPKHVENLTTRTLAPFRLPNVKMEAPNA